MLFLPSFLLGPSQHQQRSSSVASSISSPSLSEPEQEREDISSASSSRLSSKASPRSPAEQIEESADVLDLFSTPILSKMPAKKRSSNVPLSSSGETVSRRKISSSIPRSSSPIHQHPPTPVPTSIKGKSFDTVEKSNDDRSFWQVVDNR